MTNPFPILLVDNDPFIVDVLSRVSQQLFVEAQFMVVASFAQAATYLASLHGHGPSLVLLDVDLKSKQNGLDFLAMLRQHPQGQSLPVVMLSANQDRRLINEAYERGANAFTSKPFNYQGWKTYVSQLRTYWFEAVITPTA